MMLWFLFHLGSDSKEWHNTKEGSIRNSTIMYILFRNDWQKTHTTMSIELSVKTPSRKLENVHPLWYGQIVAIIQWNTYHWEYINFYYTQQYQWKLQTWYQAIKSVTKERNSFMYNLKKEKPE